MLLSIGSILRLKATVLILWSLFALSPISSRATGNITLNWTASPDTSVVSYKLYYGSLSGVYTNSVSVGNTTSVTISNLADSVTYYFAATALDTNGLESVFSNEAAGSINAPNQAPTLNIMSNVTINEDAGLQTVNLSGISSGATNEVQTMTVVANSSNPGLIPDPVVSYTSPGATGSIAFAPLTSAFGSATITVTVNDGGASNNTISRSFVVTVNSANDLPTLNALSNLAVSEDAGLQTVNLSGISSGAANELQTLSVTATSSNPGLIPNPFVTYTSPNATGSLSFTPALSSSGSATITVVVNDGGTSNNTVSRSFVVTVNSANDAPTLNTLSDISINEDSGLQTVNLSGISSGATNEIQTLAVTATSSNPSLIPNPFVTYTSPNATGTLTMTPAASAFGSATITVTVNDGGASNNVVSRSFTVTVNPVNDPPRINALSNITINEDAGVQTVDLSGISSGATNEVQTLTVTATSSNPGLIPNPIVSYTSPDATGALTFTPVSSVFGSATITVTVNDGGTSNNPVSRSFTVTTISVNDEPTLGALVNVNIDENAGPQTVNLSNISSGATNEIQTLTVTATSSNPSLIPNPSITYTSPNGTGSLSFTPVAFASGSATITVTVNDGSTSNNTVSRLFTVLVNQVNQPPSISTFTNRIMAVSTTTPAIPFTISDIETTASSLTLSAKSGNPVLVARTVTITPASGQTGISMISIVVSDGSASTTNTFQLTVFPRPAAPGNLLITAQ
jgi:hypothetical protein